MKRRSQAFPNRGGGDRGAVTAEFALILPSVVMMAVLLLCLVRGATASMGCQDAASAAARQVVALESSIRSGGGYAPGADPEAVAGKTAHAIAGEGATVSTHVDAGRIEVTVQCPVLPDSFGFLPVNVHGSAVGIAS
ncbi:MAG: pilus assembly protein [Bifidobacterium sp.]|jgi:Flp pilus assembly protein TadG|nr:pilus assembly protein [Bifidobacterium sp.]MCI1864742.1 pilus assembly protein [Bifidobacterium sp.]